MRCSISLFHSWGKELNFYGSSHIDRQKSKKKSVKSQLLKLKERSVPFISVHFYFIDSSIQMSNIFNRSQRSTSTFIAAGGGITNWLSYQYYTMSNDRNFQICSPDRLGSLFFCIDNKWWLKVVQCIDIWNSFLTLLS